MKDKVNVKQLALLLLLVLSGGKFLSLPSMLANQIGHDSWLAVAFSFAFDAVGLAFLLWAIKLNKNNLGISEILNKSLGKIASKLLLSVFFVMFITRTIILAMSCYQLFSVTFDVNTNWILFVLPIVAFASLCICLGFKAIARMGQLLFVIIILSLVTLIATPLFAADFGELLPVAESGFGKILATSVDCGFWFSDYVFFYFVLDEIQLQKKENVFLPTFTAFVIGSILVVATDAVFVALYGSFAKDMPLAMSKIGLFSVAETTNGRWDWITMSVWVLAVLIKMTVFVFCAHKCVGYVFEKNFSKINVPTVSVIAALLMAPLFVNEDAFMNKFVTYAKYAFYVAQYALPLVMPLLVRVAVQKSTKNKSEVAA